VRRGSQSWHVAVGVSQGWLSSHPVQEWTGQPLRLAWPSKAVSKVSKEPKSRQCFGTLIRNRWEMRPNNRAQVLTLLTQKKWNLLRTPTLPPAAVCLGGQGGGEPKRCRGGLEKTPAEGSFKGGWE